MGPGVARHTCNKCILGATYGKCQKGKKEESRLHSFEKKNENHSPFIETNKYTRYYNSLPFRYSTPRSNNENYDKTQKRFCSPDLESHNDDWPPRKAKGRRRGRWSPASGSFATAEEKTATGAAPSLFPTWKAALRGTRIAFLSIGSVTGLKRHE